MATDQQKPVNNTAQSGSLPFVMLSSIIQGVGIVVIVTAAWVMSDKMSNINTRLGHLELHPGKAAHDEQLKKQIRNEEGINNLKEHIVRLEKSMTTRLNNVSREIVASESRIITKHTDQRFRLPQFYQFCRDNPSLKCRFGDIE